MTPSKSGATSLIHRRVVLFLVAALLFVLFYSLNSGITCTNDGSHFALVDSLVSRTSARLAADSRDFAGHDVSVYEGQTFAGRDPGLAFLGYLYLTLFEPVLPVTSIVQDPYGSTRATARQAARISVLMLLPAAFGAALFLVIYLLNLHFGVPTFPAIFLSASCMLSTALFRYSTLFYSHIATATFVCLSVLLLFRSRSARYARSHIFLSGALLGYAVVCEPLSAIAIPFFALYVARNPSSDWAFDRRSLFLGLGLLPPAALIVSYNYANFGSFFSGAYFNHATFAYAHSLRSMFSLSQTPYWVRELLVGAPPFFSILRASCFLLTVLSTHICPISGG